MQPGNWDPIVRSKIWFARLAGAGDRMPIPYGLLFIMGTASADPCDSPIKRTMVKIAVAVAVVNETMLRESRVKKWKSRNKEELKS